MVRASRSVKVKNLPKSLASTVLAPVRAPVFAPALVFALVLIFSSGANARQSTTAFTCEAVKQLVTQKGAVVLNTNSNSVIHIYGRFVANGNYCKWGQRVIQHSVPTKSSSCRLKICIDDNSD